ncbi:MAG: PilZ domain-containing protein [Tardiphaga sp.]
MSVNSFFKQRAVNIVVDGQYALDHWYNAQGKPRTFSCHTSRVSPFRMMVAAPVLGKVGDHVSSYFSDFGNLEGRISDITEREFLLELNLSGTMRKRLADKLDWLERQQKDPSIRDLRKHPRSVPTMPHSLLTFADGSVLSCFIIDVSLSGAALSADVQPEIGTPLALGSCVGRVVRHLPGGFAIQFVQEQTNADLEHRIARPAPRKPRRASMAARSAMAGKDR